MEKQTKTDIVELARGYLGVLIMSILMMTGVVSGMYAGDSISFETNITNPVYTVIGNTSNLEGLSVTFENNNITISTVINYKPDNFTLIFFDNITNEVIKEIHTSSHSSGSTRYVDRNVTVIQPVFYDRNITEIVEVEKIGDNSETIVVEKGYKLYQVIWVLAAGVGLGWLIFRKKKDDLDLVNEE